MLPVDATVMATAVWSTLAVLVILFLALTLGRSKTAR